MCSNVERFLEKLSLQALLILPLFVCFLLFLYKWIDTNKATAHRKAPPSPPKLPVLGHLHHLGTHPHRSLKSLSRRYGELMLMHLGSKPTVIVSSANVAKQIMKTHDATVSNRPKSSVFDKLLYGSRDVAASPYGEYWRQMKSICVLKLLSNTRVRSFRAIREEETTLLIEKIKDSTSEVNLSEMFVALTNDVVCRAAFGRKYSENQQVGREFKAVLKDFAELLGVFNVGDFIPWLSWVNKFTGFDKKINKVAKKIDFLLEEIISEHSNQLNGKENRNDGKNRTKDFVDVLLEIQREATVGFSIERDSIKALILDAFAAGTDTTYTVMDWAMSELLRHPETMKELQEEVRGITKGEEGISEDNLEKMKYLKAVFKETLRLHPPIPLLMPRLTAEELEINGYHIAANTQVIINASAIQTDPATWEDPDEFRPQRFLNSAIDFKGQNFQLIPFGAGRRVCPGILFSMASNEIVLANLVNQFNWSLPNRVTCETLDMSECSGLTMHRKTPLLAVATPALL